jgi:hypothetical protein
VAKARRDRFPGWRKEYGTGPDYGTKAQARPLPPGFRLPFKPTPQPRPKAPAMDKVAAQNLASIRKAIAKRRR